LLTILIGVIAFVVIYAAAGNGEFGAVGIAVVILLVLHSASHSERQEWKAYRNRRDYWASGGPNRKR
jgi:hypothetical protein